MLSAPPALLRFSTETLPERDRVAAFREEFTRQILNMDFVDHTGGKPRIDITFLKLGPVAAGRCAGTASEFIRDARRVKDGVGDFQLLLVAKGQVRGHHARQDLCLDAGSGALFDFGQTYRAGGWSGAKVTNVTVPAAMLKALVPYPEDRAGHLVRSGPALRLLDGYLAALMSLDEPPPAELGHLIGLHLLDLVAAVIGPTAEAQQVIAGRGLKAARLRVTLAEIARRCGSPGLNIDSVAGRLGLSRRSVQRLLEETGKSFTEHLTERRLDRAHAMLADPDCSHLKMVEIALSAGFGDISHFNRQFRRRFGETPSSMRAANRHSDQADKSAGTALPQQDIFRRRF